MVVGLDFRILPTYMVFFPVPDYVFDPTCSTSKVYEQGARDVALSALNGINGTVHFILVPKFRFNSLK